RPISILLTVCMVIIVAIIMFDIPNYVLDFIDNIPAIDRLSDESHKFNSKLPIYGSLLVVFIVILLLFSLADKRKLNLN
ncbi:hypothetical protein NAI62_11720, partial [Francisella tularensis subsp. holarctica]|nr:hypothetical protein [Francisella tularensis subsp. holarctica]